VLPKWRSEMMAADTREALIEQALTFLWKPGKVIELRIPGTNQGTQAGYFDGPDLLKQAALKLDKQAPGIYVTLNPVNPDLMARGANRVRPFVKQGEGTNDKDVTKRSFFPVDFDAIRPAGISSTDEEHDAAILKATECRSWLKERGWPQPLMADSGNGAHLVYAVDLPNDDAIKTVMERCLKALGVQFNDDQVEVDRTTFNASRIWKLYGTHVCKGDSTLDRPHRLASIAEAPESLDLVPLELLGQLADLAPQPNATKPGRVNGRTLGAPRGTGDYTTLDVVGWFDAHGHYGNLLESDKHAVRCPWSDQHSDNRPAGDSDTVVWEATDGKWARFHCSHNHCIDRNLEDVALLWGDADSFCSKEFQPQRSANSPTRTPADSNSVYSVNSVYGWENPQPFESVDVPTFPVDTLPPEIAEYVRQEAEAKQVPVDLPGCLVLGATATAVAGKVNVSLNNDWSEPLNNFFVVVLHSGERKSPEVREIFGPLEEIEKRIVADKTPVIVRAQTERDILDKRLQVLKTTAAKAAAGERISAEVDARELATELAGFYVPSLPRLLADDATPEAVAGLLAEQGGRIAIVSTEGGIFDIIAGRYSEKVPNLDVYLKGYSGDPIRVDRRSRPPESIANPCLTVVITVQPDVIRDLANNRAFRGRGFLARWSYSLPASKVGYRDTESHPVLPEVRANWRETLGAIANLPYPVDTDPPLIHLSPEARSIFQVFRRKVEAELRPGGEFDDLADWGNKLCGNVARYAGLLHVLTYARDDKNPWDIRISTETMESAIALGNYFKEHAKAAFASMGADPRIPSAKKVWAVIVRREWGEFSVRDLHQLVRRSFKTVADLDITLTLLVDLGYLRGVTTSKLEGRGQLPSPRYEVNPLTRTQNTQSTQNSGYSGTEEDSDVPAGSARF